VNQEKAEMKEMSDIYVRFIDILFAVVIGQSFVLLSSENRFTSWFAQPYENAIKIATYLLVFVLVITSWVGYHRSVSLFPIRSALRFVIDIGLLFLYYLGFVSVDNFEIVLWIFFFSFLMYTVWDCIRLWEYWDVSLLTEIIANSKLKKEFIRRVLISGVFALFFFLLIIIYRQGVNKIQGFEWTLFMAALMLLVIYRYLKWYKRPIFTQNNQKS